MSSLRKDVFESYAVFVTSHSKALLVVWLLLAAVMLPFAVESNNIVSYTISVPSSNNESRVAENIVSTNFQSYQQPNETYYVIIEGSDVLTPYFYKKYLQLNQTLFADLGSKGLDSVDSVYALEYSILRYVTSNVTESFSTIESFLNSTSNSLIQVRQNLTDVNAQEYSIYNSAKSSVAQILNMSMLINQTNFNTYQLRDRINRTSQMVYGIPSRFLSVWAGIYTSSGSYYSTQLINQFANSTFVSSSDIMTLPQPSPTYYSIFYEKWSSLTSPYSPSYVSSNLLRFGSLAINQTLQSLSSIGLNQTELQFIYHTANSFNVTDYNSSTLLNNVTLSFATSGLQQQEAYIVQQSFLLGPSPSLQSIQLLALRIVTQSLPPSQAMFVQQAFQAYENSSLSSFTVNYFVQQAMKNQPSIDSLLRQKLNISLYNFSLTAFGLGNPPNEALLSRSSEQLIASAIVSNSTLSYFLSNYLNITADSFVHTAMLVNGSRTLTSKSIELTAKGISYEVSKFFYLDYDQQGILNLVNAIQNGSLPQSEAPSYLLSSFNFSQLPVRPGAGMLGQFVSHSRNTTIVSLIFNRSLSAQALNNFESIVSSFNSSFFRTHYTATSILNNDVRDIISESERVAIPFGLIIALLVAGIFFLSPLAAIIPLLMFGVSLGVGFGLVDLILGHLQGEKLSYISPIIISVLGLGLAADYAVLLLNRFGQELSKGQSNPAKISTRWAGEAIFTSGLTVIMSYLALSLSGIPLFSDVGTANVIVVSVILLSSLTLLPAVMSIGKEALFWPRKANRYHPSRLSKLTKWSIKHPKSVVGTLVIITLLALSLALTLPVNINFLSLAPNTPAKLGLDQITSNFGGSLLLPEYVVVQFPSPLSCGNNTFNMTELNVLYGMLEQVKSHAGVKSVFGLLSPFNETIQFQNLNSMPDDERAITAKAMIPYLSSDNRTTYMKVVFSGDPFSNSVLREAYNLSRSISQPQGYSILVGGISTDSYGVLQYVFDVLPKIIIVLIAAIFFVLFLQLRSVFTPLRLIATILSSVTWTLALIWIIFYGLTGLSIYVFAPLFLVTTMLGVGMDYDIFLITRVREEVINGSSDEDALVTASETTGSVIVALGLILGSVFFGLVLTQVKLLQQIGLTLTFGVLLDTIVVWLMFVPGIMVLAKKLNWWPSDPRKKKGK